MHVLRGRRGQHDLVRSCGHPPGREHDHRPLAAHRGVGVALDRDVTGLRPADTGVVDAGHIPVGGHGPEHAVRRPGILAVVAEERGQLPGLPEPFGVAGRIGDTGREGEGRQHPEHPGDRADQGRPDRHRGAPAAGLEREPCSHDQGHREVRGGGRRRDHGPAPGRLACGRPTARPPPRPPSRPAPGAGPGPIPGPGPASPGRTRGAARRSTPRRSASTARPRRHPPRPACRQPARPGTARPRRPRWPAGGSCRRPAAPGGPARWRRCTGRRTGRSGTGPRRARRGRRPAGRPPRRR